VVITNYTLNVITSFRQNTQKMPVYRWAFEIGKLTASKTFVSHYR